MKAEVEVVILSSGKKVTLIRDPNRPPIKIGHLLTDREWSGPAPERNTLVEPEQTPAPRALVSTARAAYDAYGELIRAGAPDTPEVHAERVSRLTSWLEGQYRDDPEMVEENPVSALQGIPRALRLTWKEMSEAEQCALAAQFPLARLIPQSL